jgi:quercetin dioxygenase-like cupin family protein
MMTRRAILGNFAGLAVLEGIFTAQGRSGGGAEAIFEHDVPDLTMKGWTVTAVEVSYAPGESTGAHRHPGITIAYVLEGEIRSKVGDEPERTYTAGQMFLETPGQLHAVSGNASATRPAKLLAVMLFEKGLPRTTPAD